MKQNLKRSRNIPTLNAAPPYSLYFRNSLMYSNWMVTYAGYIIERMTGKTFEEVMYQVFDKAGMKDSGFMWDVKGNVAEYGYRVNGTWVKIDRQYPR